MKKMFWHMRVAMRLTIGCTAALLMYYGLASAQIRIVKEEQLPLDRTKVWSSPKFSPDGATIYFTSSGYNGIWCYSLRDATVREITGDNRAGYGFVLSDDGHQIAYRRTVEERGMQNRVQQIVVRDLRSGSSDVVATGDNLSLPAWTPAGVIYSVSGEVQGIDFSRSATRPILLGIEDTKIAILFEGRKNLLDPLGSGSYIWPALSPDGTRIVATEMSQGAFVCSPNGNVIARLGRRNGAVWTRSGRWLVYMRDRDDGHQIVSSDLFAVSANGRRTLRLTSTRDRHELNPACSPTSNMIASETTDGEILLFTYEETGR